MLLYDLSPSANDLENRAKLSLDFCALFSHKTTSTHLGKCANSTDFSLDLCCTACTFCMACYTIRTVRFSLEQRAANPFLDFCVLA